MNSRAIGGPEGKEDTPLAEATACLRASPKQERAFPKPAAPGRGDGFARCHSGKKDETLPTSAPTGKMGATRVRLPFGGCASTEAKEVQMPGLAWLVWAAIVAGCLLVWLLV